MVKTVIKNNKKYFQCQECGFVYKTKGWASKCEKFCKKNKSCSIEITKHSVKF